MRCRVFRRLLLTLLLLLSAGSVSARAAEFIPIGAPPTEGSTNYATALSRDGSTVVGARENGGGSEAFLWTRSTGQLGLGDLPGADVFSVANGVSRDGAVVVGVGSVPGSGPFSAFR
jgi:hypothetical protein